MFSLSKQQFILSRETIQNVFCTELCPLCDLGFLSSIKHPTAKRWHPHAVLCLVLTLSQTSPGFYVSAVHSFLKHCGKRRNCSSRAISPFPTVFSTRLKNFPSFSSNLKLSSANCFSLALSKICRLARG